MEANTEQRKWFIPCCENEECHICNGKGMEYPERCPIYYYKYDVKNLRFLYENYKNKNILPFSGSPIEQPKILIETFDLIDYYVFLFKKIKNKKIEENRETTELLKKKIHG